MQSSVQACFNVPLNLLQAAKRILATLWDYQLMDQMGTAASQEPLSSNLKLDKY